MSDSEDFEYRPASDAAGLPASVSIFCDRSALRQQMGDDLREAGFRIVSSDRLEVLISGNVSVLGDAVLIDCVEIDAEGMAALSRIDMRIARSGARAIISTSLAALDGVFACFDQTSPQILVDPSRAERIVAVGQILGQVAGARLRELSGNDRLALIRLSEQVDAIARKLEGITGQALDSDDPDSRLSDRRTVFRGMEDGGAGLGRQRPQLPPASHIRDLIRRRQARAKFFEGELFADPAWDMLLDLTAAHIEKAQVSVTSLCIASGVPPTTALRWLRQMTEAGLFERVDDVCDKRRAFISLSDKALMAMASYFTEIGEVALARAA